MAQPLAGDFPINPQTVDGTELSDILNRLAEAAYSSFRGTNRPSDATGGLLWTKLKSNGSSEVVLYDGTRDVTLFQVTTSGAVTAPFTYTQTQIDNKISDAASGVQGSVVNRLTAGSQITISGATGTNPTIAHADTSSQGSVNNSNGTVIQDIYVDGNGHVTSIGSYNLDGRYYTESEANSRFVNSAGDTMTGNLSFSGSSQLKVGTDGRLYVGSGFFYKYGTQMRLDANGGGGDFVFEEGGGISSSWAVLRRDKADDRYATKSDGYVVGMARIGSDGKIDRKSGIITGSSRTGEGRYKVNFSTTSWVHVSLTTQSSPSSQGNHPMLTNVGSSSIEYSTHINRDSSTDGEPRDCACHVILFAA